MSQPDPKQSEPGPWGDESRHVPLEQIESALADFSPPKDRGEIALIVARRESEQRETPARTRLTRDEGVPGDAWRRSARRKPDAQITVMRADFGRLVANGQPLTLFGDNLLVDLDLSVENLPTGTRLRAGGALLEVTPEPHTGCRKYRQRFGGDALRVTADKRHRDDRLRGLYVKVVEEGDVAVGDVVEVVSRG